MKLLFELFPIVLFFAAYKVKGIFAATAVAIAATVVQILYALARNKKVEPMLWVSMSVITVFGGATLVSHNANFIKVKPTILYAIFSVVLITGRYVFGRNFIKLMLAKQLELTERAWDILCMSWACFFAFVATLNLWVAFRYPTDVWVNFKLFGIMGLMFIFVFMQALFLARQKTSWNGTKDMG